MNAFNEFFGPVSDESACGQSMDNSENFLSIDALINQSMEHGIDQLNLDWKSGMGSARYLLQSSRDIRVAVWMSRVALQLYGYKGLADGIELVHAYLNQYWGHVHPLIEDGDDFPIALFNALGDLVSIELFLTPIKYSPLVELKGFGAITFRDWQLATSKNISKDTANGLTEGVIIAAMNDANSDQLVQVNHDIERCVQALSSLEKLLYDSNFSEFSPNLDALKNLLGEILHFIGNNADFPSSDEANSEIQDGDQVSLHHDGDVLATELEPQMSSVGGNMNRIQNRQEVEAAINSICDYFRRVEPSSPVPLLLNSAKSLLNKDFVEILKEFAPTGLNYIEKYSVTSDLQNRDGAE